MKKLKLTHLILLASCFFTFSCDVLDDSIEPWYNVCRTSFSSRDGNFSYDQNGDLFRVNNFSIDYLFQCIVDVDNNNNKIINITKRTFDDDLNVTDTTMLYQLVYDINPNANHINDLMLRYSYVDLSLNDAQRVEYVYTWTDESTLIRITKNVYLIDQLNGASDLQSSEEFMVNEVSSNNYLTYTISSNAGPIMEIGIQKNTMNPYTSRIHYQRNGAFGRTNSYFPTNRVVEFFPDCFYDNFVEYITDLRTDETERYSVQGYESLENTVSDKQLSQYPTIIDGPDGSFEFDYDCVGQY